MYTGYTRINLKLFEKQRVYHY